MCCQLAAATFPLVVALLDMAANRLGMTSMRIRTGFARAPQLPMPHAQGFVARHRCPRGFEASARDVDIF
jgi:hypothetical protein